LVENKIAIVTGAGRGIGRAIALQLAKQGAHVLVSDIDPESACSVAREIQALGRRSMAVRTDVSDEPQVQMMVRQCVEGFGKIDILVNNAGIVSTGSLTEISAEAWDRTMQVNLKSVFLCCKAVFPLMMAQRSGKIVNIASVAGKRGGGCCVQG